MNHLHIERSLIRASSSRPDTLLEQYYDRLQTWALQLTRGDIDKALDIVHDLCVHMTVSPPDLTKVHNIDGYLYTCLRHLYLSGITRSAREALWSIGIEDLDSIQVALRSHAPGDPLEQQNDLRRICAYVIWRKDQTKSASYFILRFFHGYSRSEIATIASVPLSTVDPKLNKVRSEVHLYLTQRGKLQFTNREQPPSPAMHWSLVSPISLFKELQESILAARNGDCLPESELLAYYQTPVALPISCSHLSHLVSCERCLTLIDSHFQRPTLIDREPFSGLNSRSDNINKQTTKAHSTNRDAVLRSAYRESFDILEHRLRTISIAVDGRILACHDVRAERNRLSARIERPETISFIEVFSEQGFRLALISLSDFPPSGTHEQTQRVALSDDRWIELKLIFDGLGMDCEVVYRNPTFLANAMEADVSEAIVVQDPIRESIHDRMPSNFASSLIAIIRRCLATPLAVCGSAAIVLIAALVFGIVARRINQHTQLPTQNAQDIINRSIDIDATNLEGQTEHQVLHFEEAANDGTVLTRGVIDTWKDGNGLRYKRRLYDDHHRLVAAEWRMRNEEHGEYQELVEAGRSHAELIADSYWKQNVSAVAFRDLARNNVQVRITKDGFDLIADRPNDSQPKLIWAMLSIDHSMRPIREVLRVRSREGIHEIRFVQADYQRRPSELVPDDIFKLRDYGESRVQGPKFWSDQQSHFPEQTPAVRSTELYIATLYALNSLKADIDDPIAVERTTLGHIRVTGTVATDSRRLEIESHLHLLKNSQLLELDLASPGNMRHDQRPRRTFKGSIHTYEIGSSSPAAALVIQEYFAAQGLSQPALDAAVSGFSRDALEHALRALQNASALKRLSVIGSAPEIHQISLAARQQWTEMVAQHASALEIELRTLHEQLSVLTPSTDQYPGRDASSTAIETVAQFSRAVDQLLIATKQLDQRVSDVFASSQAMSPRSGDIRLLIANLREEIPLYKAVELTSLAVQLNASETVTARTRPHRRLKP